MKQSHLTHMAAALLGFGVVWFAVSAVVSVRTTAAPMASDPPAGGPVDRGGDAVGERGRREAKDGSRIGRSSDDFRSAWRAIAAKRLPSDQRFQLQVEVLTRWAEVDLKGALQAALSEPWDDSNGSNLLVSAFSQVFIDRSDEVWRMIQSKDFGSLGSARVRTVWAAVIAEKDPGLFLTYVPEMEGIALRNAVRAIADHLVDGADVRRFWQAWSENPGLNLPGEDARDLARRFSYGLSSAELTGPMLSGTGFIRELACDALAMRVAGPEGAAGFGEAIGTVPDDLKDRFAAVMLQQGYGRREVIVPAVEYLVAREQWEVLGGENIGGQIRSLTRNMDPVELAHWVDTLPPRQETAEIFHRGVEPYIQQDREAAWEWMSHLEPGMWRDRAFAEYSQQALHGWRDPEASRAALDQIEDPEFKATAEQWRADWEQQTGGAP